MTAADDFNQTYHAFPLEEYEQRLSRVQARMQSRGIDLLLVTSPPNLTYLTGYDAQYYSRVLFAALALPATGKGTIFFETKSHSLLIERTAQAIAEVVHLPELGSAQPMADAGRAALDLIVSTLRDRHLLTGAIGLDPWSRNPAKPIYDLLEAELSGAGARVVDASWLVDHVRLVKSPREIEVVLKAAEIADAGMQAIQSNLRPGMMETEIWATAHLAMARMGGEDPAIRTLVRVGRRRGAIHHVLPSTEKVRAGDLVIVDYCASYKRYHVDLARNFSLGEPDPRWVKLLETSALSIERVVRELRPGEPMSRVAHIAGAYLKPVGLARYGWFIGGYDLGIPPDWVGHTQFGAPSFEEVNYDVGMVTNFENVFDILDVDWPGGACVSYIDTMLMTDRGLQILSKLPRTVLVC